MFVSAAVSLHPPLPRRGRFEKVAAVVPGLNMADKHQRIAEYYSRLVTNIQRHYLLHKDSPPVAWNEPPLAGMV